MEGIPKKVGRKREFPPCEVAVAKGWKSTEHKWTARHGEVECRDCRRKRSELRLRPLPEVKLPAGDVSKAMAGNPPEDATLQYEVDLPSYELHKPQKLLIESPKKRKVVKAGRRGGKTEGSVILAVKYFLRGKRVRYCAPVEEQTERFWRLVKHALREPLSYNIYVRNETDKIIEPAGSLRQQIRAMTGWNADTLRGDNCDLLILEEYQLMDEMVWEQVGQPMLVDYNGDALIIFTPPSLQTRSVSKARDKLHAAKFFREKLKDDHWLCVHFRTQDNPFVSAEGIDEAARGMNALAYRQEILAEDVDEVPGALWTRKLIEETRVAEVPCEMRRVVVGVDPSGSNMTTTETGIVAAGEGIDGHFYVLADRSRTGTPHEWAQSSVRLYYDLLADRIVAERNYGGDMVQETIRNVDDNVSYRDVVASRGKVIRAQPITALFERKKAHLAGSFPELEEQMVSYTPGDKSPDRMDAMVWAISELVGQGSFGVLEAHKSGIFTRMWNGLLPKKDGNNEVPAIAASSQGSSISSGSATTEKAQTSTSLACIERSDQEPSPCPQCGAVLWQAIGGVGLRCGQCGLQVNRPLPAKPQPGRKIYFDKLGQR